MCLGIPGRVIEIHDDLGIPMGIVDFGGLKREVCLAYVADEIQPGDYAVVHVGFAISKVDEAEAVRTFEVLREMSELDELEWMREVADRSMELADSDGASASSEATASGEGTATPQDEAPPLPESRP